jgi:cytochrome c-type biogenesis protein CcmH/NrfG
VHAAADWDWELPAVTMTALICAAALLVSARDQEGLRSATARARIAASAVVVAVGAFALVGLIGNSALSASANATGKENWRTADTQARKVTRWAPWSSEGWRVLGESELQQAKFGAARQSFQKAIAKSPRDWNLWLDLALASGGQAKHRAALEALRLNPRSPEIAQIAPSLGLGKGAASAGS